MLIEEVLVVRLGGVERPQRYDRRDDSIRENFRVVELLDVRVRNPLLLAACEEDGRTVLRAAIGTLTIEFGWIVRYGEVHFEQLSV